MPRREDEPTVRVHLHLFSSDHEWLKDHFGDSTGVAKAVRRLVRGFIRKIEEKAELTQPTHSEPIELGELNEHPIPPN